MELCPYCGEWASLDVSEVILDTRELVVDACCEDNLSGWVESIELFGRRERARWMFEKTGLIVKDILATPSSRTPAPCSTDTPAAKHSNVGIAGWSPTPCAMNPARRCALPAFTP